MRQPKLISPQDSRVKAGFPTLAVGVAAVIVTMTLAVLLAALQLWSATGSIGAVVISVFLALAALYCLYWKGLRMSHGHAATATAGGGLFVFVMLVNAFFLQPPSAM